MSAQPNRANVKSAIALKQNVTKFPAETVLFEEGDTSTDVYLLLNGTVAVLKRVDDDEIKEVAVIEEPMTYFGEMAALLGEPRSATIKTKTVCEFVVLPGAKLDSIVDVSPQVGKKLLRTLAARLAETNKMAVAANNQLKLVKQKFSAEYGNAAKDYKRLVMTIEMVFNDSKLPQVQELLGFSRNNSILAKMGVKSALTSDHLKQFTYLSKAYKNFTG